VWLINSAMDVPWDHSVHVVGPQVAIRVQLDPSTRHHIEVAVDVVNQGLDLLLVETVLVHSI
jgi:hypothetical protein